MEEIIAGLYIIGTPIGNINDTSFRAKKYLQEVDFIACEDTRVMKKFLNLIEVKKDSKQLISIHEHNESSMSKKIVELIESGKSVAYTSDAGMPGVSDPGQILVETVRKEELFLTCIPGPTAVTTALSLSGIANPSFTFAGFFPRVQKDISKLVESLKRNHETVVFYESPKRLKKTLEILSEFLGESRQCIVARELTKKFEEVKRGSLKELIGHFDGEVKGEIVVLVEAKAADDTKVKDFSEGVIHSISLLKNLGVSSKDSIEILSNLTELPKNRLKELFLNSNTL